MSHMAEPTKVSFVEHDARKESVSVNKWAGVLSTDNEHCVTQCYTEGAAPCLSPQPENVKPEALNSETGSFQEPVPSTGALLGWV